MVSNNLVEGLVWINFVLSGVATYYTGKLFIRFHRHRHAFNNGRRRVYIALQSTFALFFAFSFVGLLLYFNRLFHDNTNALLNIVGILRTTLVTIAVTILARHFDRMDK